MSPTTSRRATNAASRSAVPTWTCTMGPNSLRIAVLTPRPITIMSLLDTDLAAHSHTEALARPSSPAIEFGRTNPDPRSTGADHRDTHPAGVAVTGQSTELNQAPRSPCQQGI